jgi:hypothetical protein
VGAHGTDPAVLDLAEEHRRHRDCWPRDCPTEVRRELAAGLTSPRAAEEKSSTHA